MVSAVSRFWPSTRRAPTSSRGCSLPSTGLVLTSVSGRWQGRSKPRGSQMNQKELARGYYPATYHRDIILSQSKERIYLSLFLSLGFSLGNLFWRRKREKERERHREARGRKEGFSEDPPTRAPTLIGDGMLHVSSVFHFDVRRRSLGEPEMLGVGAMDSGMDLFILPPGNTSFNPIYKIYSIYKMIRYMYDNTIWW